MAKKPTNRTSKHQRRDKEEEFVQIDIFKVPAQQAEMYTVLREAVAEETLAIWSDQYDSANVLATMRTKGKRL